MSETNTEANTPNTEANKEEEKRERKREYMREYMRRKRQEQREKEEKEEGKEEKKDLGEALVQSKEIKKKGGWKEYLIIAVIAGIILLMPFLQNYIQPILAKLNLRKNNGGAWE